MDHSGLIYLTDPQAHKAQKTYRYFAEVAIGIDSFGVPHSCEVLDVLVVEPGEEAIKNLIATKP